MLHKTHSAIVQVGRNCWRQEKAQRVAVAIDGEAYFRAVREAILAARRSVFILGWDIHSKLKLVRETEEDGFPVELGALLNFVAKHRAVDVYVLSWDFAMIYLIEREPLPLYRLNWQTHSRVRFRMDDRHPVGERLEFEESVRRDSEIRAGKIRHDGFAARRDNDVPCAEDSFAGDDAIDA